MNTATMNDLILRPKEKRLIDPSGSRIFCIGDVKGNYYALQALLTKIEEYERAQNDVVVFLGNYIGWGKKSKECFNLLLQYQAADKESVHLLKGKTEFLVSSGFVGKSPDFVPIKKSYVTQRKVNSYPLSTVNDRVDIPKLMEHMHKMEELPYKMTYKNILFTNSGLDFRKTKVDDLTEGACLFSTNESMRKYDSCIENKFLVHGGIPTQNGEVDVRKNRINLCTIDKGYLSAVVLKGSSPEDIEVEEEIRVKIE